MGAERDFVAPGGDAEFETLGAAVHAATSGRFRLRRSLGRGGMGVVWEADDATLGEQVALKTLQHVDARALLRFKNEFRAVRDVHHPNLVRLGEFFEANGVWFFTMELVAGRDLLAWVHGGAPVAEESTIAAAGGPSGRAIGTLGRSSLDFALVRALFAQLATALEALHANQLIHRDVKPGNVRVTPDGRVVLLDFGLVADSAIAPSIDGGIVGTVSYMAPEQASGGAVGPSADWYAFGATLYEVLTGRVPFDGPVLQVLLDKQRLAPTPPRTVAPDVPPDLDALCTALLAFDPLQRPTAHEVLRKLGDPQARARPSTSSTGPLFVGRARELALLQDALDEVARRGAPVTVRIDGEPGIGKSALAAHFGGHAAADDALVLRGRCYEHESLPYKALDGIVDSLAAALCRMPKDRAAAAAPRYVALLLRLFPVLGRVEAFRAAPQPRGTPSDPLEQRRRAFGALRELFTRIAETGRLVLIIDDVQWSDPDGVELLRATLSPPDPPAMLVVLTSSTAHAAASPRDWPTDLRPISLAPLDGAAAEELARGLLGNGDEALATSLVRETHGHPLLLAELTRYSVAQPPGARAAASLEDAVDQTLRGLQSEARVLIELLTVAGAPVSQRALARAMQLSPGEVGRLIGSLRVARMVRTDRSIEADLVECIHDRVRDAVQARLSPGDSRWRHAALATALEVDPAGGLEGVARHYLAAGDVTRAIAFWERAAIHALETLAFESAARLYRRLLEHDTGATPARRLDLQRKLADALVGAGRGKEAADAYVEASRGANAAERMDLQRLAAGHLMRAGHIDDGIALLRRVLGDVGLEMPAGGIGGIMRLLWSRLVIVLRGYGFVWRDESQIPRSTLTLIDALSATIESSAMLEPVSGAVLNARYLRAALAAGEPRRVVRALLAEAMYQSVIGAPMVGRVDRALAAATKVIDRLGDPVLRAMRSAVFAVAEYQRGHFAASIPLIDAATEELRATGPGVHFELSLLHVFALFSLRWLGRYSELLERYREVVRDADDRGDLLGGSLARLGIASNAHLWGAHGEWRADLDAAIEPWKGRRFGLPHFLHLHGCVEGMIAEGRPGDAIVALDANADAIRSSLLLQSQLLRVLHARNAARAYLIPNSPAYEGRARACIRRLQREKVGYADAFALMFEAILALRRGAREDGLAALIKAERKLDEHQLLAWRGVATLVRGRVLGGAEGARIAAAAEKELNALGIPRAEVAVAASGFGAWAPGMGKR